MPNNLRGAIHPLLNTGKTLSSWSVITLEFSNSFSPTYTAYGRENSFWIQCIYGPTLEVVLFVFSWDSGCMKFYSEQIQRFTKIKDSSKSMKNGLKVVRWQIPAIVVEVVVVRNLWWWAAPGLLQNIYQDRRDLEWGRTRATDVCQWKLWTWAIADRGKKNSCTLV